MGRQEISATPEALERFTTVADRRARELRGALSGARGRTGAVRGSVDAFGLTDPLVAAYPEAAREATASVDDLLAVLGRLRDATEAAAERFRQADR